MDTVWQEIFTDKISWTFGKSSEEMFVISYFREFHMGSLLSMAWATGAESVRFSVEAMVRGYHAYKDVWEATFGEELQCQTEQGNDQDEFTVAVLKDGNIIGHIPWNIPAACSMFLCWGCSIMCRTIASKRSSADLLQCGMEAPSVEDTMLSSVLPVAILP